RKIIDIDPDEDITLVNDQDDAKMFDVNNLHGEEVFVEKEVAKKRLVLLVKLMPLALQQLLVLLQKLQLKKSLALVKTNTSKPNAKEIVLQEPITTAGIRVKTVSKIYYCQYKEVTAAQVEVSAAQELQENIQRSYLGKYCKPCRTPWCIKGGPRPQS
nr:hypothetical protein [Tanacetum cinerariifolium]